MQARKAGLSASMEGRVPSWQSLGPGREVGTNPTCPQSARALGVLNNAGFDTNALGIFHHREGKGQSRQEGVWPGQQEASSPILDIQGCRFQSTGTPPSPQHPV